MQQQPWAQISPLLKPLMEGGAYKRLIGSMKGEQKKLSLFGPWFCLCFTSRRNPS